MFFFINEICYFFKIKRGVLLRGNTESYVFRRQYISSKDTYFLLIFLRLHVLFDFPGKPIKQWHVAYGDTGDKGDVEDTRDIEHIKITHTVYI
jgi:hypothetical protein